ncbi:MAG: hypothetical protein ABSD59_02415 [Terracidiphilus sp.]|jgi:hypothetical protein
MNSGTPHITMTVNGSKEPSLLYSQDVEDALAADFGVILDVHYVSVERADGNLLVWVALDSPTKENRERVFQKQFELIDGFPEIAFDFNVVPSSNRSSADFASGSKLIYSREDE